MQELDPLELAKRRWKLKIEENQKRHDYAVLWRHYNDGEREWDEYYLMTRTSAKMVLLSIPIYEPHCQRAKICPLRMGKRPLEAEDCPWTY